MSKDIIKEMNSLICSYWIEFDPRTPLPSGDSIFHHQLPCEENRRRSLEKIESLLVCIYCHCSYYHNPRPGGCLYLY